MNVRQRGRLIASAAVGIGLVGLAALAAGFMTPVGLPAVETPAARPAPGRSAAPVRSPTTAADGDARRGLDKLQKLCSLNLRRPLFDPPPPTVISAGPANRPASTMTLRLVGTIHEPAEPDRSMAMFQRNDGSIVLCAKGRCIDDAGGPVEVTNVESQKATVNYAGEARELVVPPTP